MTYSFTFLRHGESVGNKEGRHQGQADFPLSELGLEQARCLAKYWREEGRQFDLIIASPLRRARQTAEIISAELGAPLEFEADWMERNAGKLQGLKPEEATGMVPDTRFRHPYIHFGITGESQWQLFLRAGRAVHGLVERPAGRYLIVSHGGILNMALYAILGITPHLDFTGPRFLFTNTGYASLTYDPDGYRWRLEGVDQHPHWTERGEPNAFTNGDDMPAAEVETSPTQPVEIVVRQATLTDRAWLYELFEIADRYHREALPEIYQPPADPAEVHAYVDSLLTEPGNVVFLALTESGPQGALHALLRETPPIPIMVRRKFVIVSNLAVREEARRLGVATALMGAAEEWARSQGAGEIELTVWEFNQGARRFYEKLGYTTAHRRMWRKV